ncbi:MAG: hypothetical protein O3A84_10545 [Proteobacteria bacterium]|nr:hypothetical protein [Pseudomonadota bacterium]
MEYGLPNIIAYRMDRHGTLFVRTPDGREREANKKEINYLLTLRPDLILQLAQSM